MRQKNHFLSLSVYCLIGFFLLQAGCRTELTEENFEAKARAIHDRVLTVDTHCDTALRLLAGSWDIGIRHEPGERASGKVDLPRMAEGGLDAEFFAVFIGQSERTEQGYAKAKERALQTLDAIHAVCKEYPDLVGLALTPDDARRLEKEGRRAAFIGMENGYPVGKTLSNLEKFYNLGVRYITLCHSADNDICDSSTDRQDPEDRGLSEFGGEVVAVCNRLGMMVDVSHASDKTFYDVLKVTKAPIIASHSSCRAICKSPRNLSDEMIRSLARNGGVIQICFLSSYIRTPKPNPEREKAFLELRAKYGARRDIQDEAVRKKAMEDYEALNATYPEEKATVSEVVDHIEHVIELVGADYVGIGTDFDGGGGVEGCDDVSKMFRVTEELVRRGRTEEEIAKVWGGNIMRVFRRVIAISKELGS